MVDRLQINTDRDDMDTKDVVFYPFSFSIHYLICINHLIKHIYKDTHA
jgi:hypothetical protein